MQTNCCLTFDQQFWLSVRSKPPTKVAISFMILSPKLCGANYIKFLPKVPKLHYDSLEWSTTETNNIKGLQRVFYDAVCSACLLTFYYVIKRPVCFYNGSSMSYSCSHLDLSFHLHISLCVTYYLYMFTCNMDRFGVVRADLTLSDHRRLPSCTIYLYTPQNSSSVA